MPKWCVSLFKILFLRHVNKLLYCCWNGCSTGSVNVILWITLYKHTEWCWQYLSVIVSLLAQIPTFQRRENSWSGPCTRRRAASDIVRGTSCAWRRRGASLASVEHSQPTVTPVPSPRPHRVLVPPPPPRTGPDWVFRSSLYFL